MKRKAKLPVLPEFWAVLRYTAVGNGLSVETTVCVTDKPGAEEAAELFNSKHWVAGRLWYEARRYVPAVAGRGRKGR